MAINNSRSYTSQIIVHHYTILKRPVSNVIMINHNQFFLKKPPTLQIRSSIKDQVFEDQSNGIVCYRDERGEIVCEGLDEGPRFHRQFPLTHRKRDAEIIDLLQQRWLSIVDGGDANGNAVLADSNWHPFCFTLTKRTSRCDSRIRVKRDRGGKQVATRYRCGEDLLPPFSTSKTKEGSSNTRHLCLLPDEGPHHGVLTSDWLTQAQPSVGICSDSDDFSATDAAAAEKEFSVIDEFNDWRKQLDLAEAVAATRALASVIHSSKATTMVELEVELKNASDDLQARRIIAMVSQDFIFDGCAVLVHGFSRMALEVLKTTAQKKKKKVPVFCSGSIYL
ncbi:hypothetical protein Nepgr_005681 [Nepenthes gracilis]|uniref:Translation initiation factor eIF2B subunit alpha n=1 Tax=Nepenthes gracilis TaxID=150966 RepID=A0AAD3S429_NEPGR|nr:hypothetical protein Nepgr_005681 [Nepenthes gracilis]